MIENYEQEIKDAGDLDSYISEKIEVRKPLIDRIKKYTPVGGTIAEWGSGTGVISAHLDLEGYNCTSIELSEDMIKLQSEIVKRVRASTNIVQGDIRSFKLHQKADTSFNNGVLEHFDEEEIICIIENIMDSSNTFVFGVPTFFNHGNLNGDERLWTYWKWKRIVEKANCDVLEAFSFFSRRKVREKINRLLGCKLFPISTGVGFVLKRS